MLHVDDAAVISHVIQLSIAPVFLLTGVGSLLNVMTGRLSRVVDRARELEASWPSLAIPERDQAAVMLKSLADRARLASWAINSCACAALLVCVTIALLFVDAFMGTQLRMPVPALFVVTMLALVFGLSCLVREVYLGTHALRIGPPETPAPPRFDEARSVRAGCSI